jgi:hypothetical protein
MMMMLKFHHMRRHLANSIWHVKIQSADFCIKLKMESHHHAKNKAKHKKIRKILTYRMRLLFIVASILKNSKYNKLSNQYRETTKILFQKLIFQSSNKYQFFCDKFHKRLIELRCLLHKKWLSINRLL